MTTTTERRPEETLPGDSPAADSPAEPAVAATPLFPAKGFGGTLTRSQPDIGLQVIDDALPEALYEELLKTRSAIYWRYGWRATNPLARYWHHEVGFGNKANTKDVSAKVREHPAPTFAAYLDWFRSCLPGPLAVLRYYLNAHTYGTDGSPHQDSDRPGEHTAICYLTEKWEAEWAGETALFDAAGDITASVLPRRNRLIVFPSDSLHAPRPLAREFLGLRVVLVMKVRLEG